MDSMLVGRNPVREALKLGVPLNKIYMTEKMAPGLAGEIKALAGKQGVPVQAVDRERLDKMAAGANHQGLIAITAAKGYVDVEDLLLKKEDGKPPFLVVLDEINDPRNLGAILRTAGAAGVNGVIIPRRRAAALTPAVSKTSAGAIEYVPVARVANIARTLEYLKECGLWIVGAHGGAKDIYWDVDFTGPIAVVIGGEDKGLGRLVRSKCDFLVQLPMEGRVSSLNASVAAALLFYEVLRQRRRD